MKKFLYIFLINIFCLLNTLNAQIRNYDIMLFGDLIGEISSHQKIISDSEYELSYTSKAEAEVFFTKTKTFLQAKIHFKNDFVKSGFIIRKKNAALQEIDFKWEDNKYTITENGIKFNDPEKIYYCTTNFFFKEPVNIHKVYVERLLKYVEIEHLGNNQYLTKVDGGTNLYTYKNGILQSLKSKKGISIFMNLRE